MSALIDVCSVIIHIVDECPIKIWPKYKKLLVGWKIWDSMDGCVFKVVWWIDYGILHNQKKIQLNYGKNGPEH